MVRAPRAVFGSLRCTPADDSSRVRRTETVRASRSTSAHRKARSSPRRTPRLTRTRRGTATREPSAAASIAPISMSAVSYTHLRAHETRHDLVCRLLLEKKKKKPKKYENTLRSQTTSINIKKQQET